MNRRIIAILAFIICISLSVPAFAASTKNVYLVKKIEVKNSQKSEWDFSNEYEYYDNGLIQKITHIEYNSRGWAWTKKYYYDDNNRLTKEKCVKSDTTMITKYYYNDNKVYKCKIKSTTKLADGTHFEITKIGKYKWKGNREVTFKGKDYTNTTSSLTYYFDKQGRIACQPGYPENKVEYDENGFVSLDYWLHNSSNSIFHSGESRSWEILKTKGKLVTKAIWTGFWYEVPMTADLSYKKIAVDKKLAKRVQMQQVSLIGDRIRPLETI